MAIDIQIADVDDIEAVIARRFDFLRDVRGADTVLDADFVRATRHFVTTEFHAGRLHSWLARDVDGMCVGLVSVLLWARPPRPGDLGSIDGYIINMFVDDVQRGQGLGRRLLRACLDARSELGIDRFLLHTTEVGRPLYESAGFAENATLLEWTPD